MNKFGSLYFEADSFFHRMNPGIKLIIFIFWLIVVFMFFDLRVSIGLLVTGFVLLKFATIPYTVSRNLFIAVLSFNFINAIFILLITPDYGVTLTGNSHILFNIAGFRLYSSTLMYILVISLKYLSLLPLTMICIFTTHPSKFAASLNQIGIPYKFAYTVSIILRYFPDIQQEFKNIANAQALRGLSFGRDEPSRIKRIRNLFNITVPLINSALVRVDKISNAMELRGFGKYRKRTWFNQTQISHSDWLTLCFATVVFVVFCVFRFYFYSGVFF
ncbi:energy-coupling factor transporter transmembrane component T family protein [Aquella oligotrophica]|uniref:Cobalamin biosynthesis protein CbiQ n=1 Tax=Aquella oligotrophica TaxID=2067065 RepID=A0A2I7N392_9NEIS|nr:energy-coupling factor transporter transmembrane component T [Aquella oligotrophica]AUR50910.1 cobalamin biosynthesis protein CbiQ [Aquella oligotrophica]